MTAESDAVRLVLLAAGGNPRDEDYLGRYHHDQCARLAMQWPSLAAALADLLAAHDYGVPVSFRAARNVLRGERSTDVELAAVAQQPETMAVGGMGACANCGHVQHQHLKFGCAQHCGCSGFVAQRAAQPLENGAWCFCPTAPNPGGRGHLRGDPGCATPEGGRGSRA